jgi:hypothetical protein
MKTIDHENYKVPEDAVLRSVQNHKLTQGLFVEFGTETAPYTLKEKNHRGRVSMYQVYMASTDEYEAAQKLLGSWSHWKFLCELTWFTEGAPEHGHSGLNAWREEMKLRDQSLARQILRERMDDGDISAAKKVYDEAKGVKSRGKVGRPTKDKSFRPVVDLKAAHSKFLGEK